MSNPFSPDFAGASGEPTKDTASSNKAATMSVEFQAPSMDPFGSQSYPSAPSITVTDMQSTGLETSESTKGGGAYGGATWTSPLEKTKQTQSTVGQDLLQQQQAQPGTAPAAPAMQHSATTGLSGLASPPPLPNSTMDMGMGAPMGGSTGTGFSTPSDSQAKEQQEANLEEDEEYQQAQRAALEAKAMMEKQAQQQQKKQQEGWGLGLGNLLQRPNHSHPAASQTSNTKPETKRNPWFQTASPTRDTSTPPWNPQQQDSQLAATSDFGIPPPATHDNTTIANTQTSNNNITGPGKGAAVVGASVVGGVAGLMLVGPLVGVVAAGGAAYAAGTKEGPVGQIMRGTGSLAATVGGTAKRFDDKHQVVAKTLGGVATGVGWVVKTVNNATPDN